MVGVMTQRLQRHTVRLQSWDYSSPGWYYVTIVAKARRCAFGEVRDDRVVLSELGLVTNQCWCQIPRHHAGIELDCHIIMPNHVHGIIIIKSHDVCRDVQLNVPTVEPPKLFASRNKAMTTLSPKRGSLSVVSPNLQGCCDYMGQKQRMGGF